MNSPKLTMRVIDDGTLGEGWIVAKVMGDEFIETVGLRASDFEDAVHGLGGPEALARLMAAAPDMLEALEAVLADHEDIDDGRLSGNTVATIRNAIKKARGQT